MTNKMCGPHISISHIVRRVRITSLTLPRRQTQKSTESLCAVAKQNLVPSLEEWHTRSRTGLAAQRVSKITGVSYTVYPIMLLLRPLKRTADENKHKLENRISCSPSSSRLSTVVQSLPIPSLYASITAENIGSESGCVDANALSST